MILSPIATTKDWLALYNKLGSKSNPKFHPRSKSPSLDLQRIRRRHRHVIPEHPAFHLLPIDFVPRIDPSEINPLSIFPRFDDDNEDEAGDEDDDPFPRDGRVLEDDFVESWDVDDRDGG